MANQEYCRKLIAEIERLRLRVKVLELALANEIAFRSVAATPAELTKYHQRIFDERLAEATAAKDAAVEKVEP